MRPIVRTATRRGARYAKNPFIAEYMPQLPLPTIVGRAPTASASAAFVRSAPPPREHRPLSASGNYIGQRRVRVLAERLTSRHALEDRLQHWIGTVRRVAVLDGLESVQS